MKHALVLLALVAGFCCFGSSKAQAQSHAVNLTWTQGTCGTGCTVTGNKVYKSATNNGPYTVLFTSTTPITAYSDSGLGAGVTGYYVVTAVCASCSPQESGYSNQVTATTPTATVAPPTNLTGTAN